ncbi:CheR family methyltransferase [Marivirga arenosa]|uniref:Protein-glutamate O-methyltransferase CheR n=1 Tax=Marivirga arenosa TaxID=3059076 RepID=A0AA49GEX7_9BACT|nr:protein-glutamate O-methyltransferase CheR [Marivirga sp. BKB1-2]WKK81604.1 protein-glutamate O-methyltransferase CheR [Marivirga sp. BKB1-2]
MNETRGNIEISDEELHSLTDAIQQRHGIDFSCYEVKSLRRRLTRTLSVFNLESIHELWMKILREQEFIYPFMDEISVGLTSLFRDSSLWKALEKKVLLEYTKKEKPLSIWHAGCSTGEEVYSMGILLQELNIQDNTKAWATDISNKSLKIAQDGEYHRMKFAEYNKNLNEYKLNRNLDKFTEPETLPNHFKLKRSLISHVTWEHHNLISDEFTKKFDIIFCRNVMIYFDVNSKIKLFKKFYNSLNPGGILIIGFYDAVLPFIDSIDFEILDIDSKIFIKK